uniref:Zinc finger and SCAN domain containing 5B n=1 Tax=Myotis lucifugus TaxID=59463 RepID=G1P722_MYOLU
SLGWALPPARRPQGHLTEGQHWDSERWHVLFRGFQHSEDADPLQSLHTMSALLHRWLRPDVLTKKQILDKLLLEKFMICMPLELQVLVKERCVQSCEELKVLLRNKEKPRKWKVVSFQGQKYLQENSVVQMADEEVGGTDYVLDLSMKFRSPISQTGVHPENSQEELTFPVNMAADQAFSDGRGLPQGNLGWELLQAETPQGILTEEQHLDSEKGHVLFRAFQHSEDADLLHSVHTMSALLHRWLRPDLLNKKQILDKLLLETFMTIMPLELQNLVKESQEVNEELGNQPGTMGASSTVEPTGHPVGKEPRRKIPYECQDCSKMFSYKSQLDLHLRTHTGERPFQCLDCPKRFIQASDLHVHQRIHTGEKPFCCKVCQKRFTHKSTLRGHQRVHTQEKPYQCAVCQKRFGHQGNLNVHMRTHSGLRPYPCPHCHLAFRQLGTFKRHQRTHVNEAP